MGDNIKLTSQEKNKQFKVLQNISNGISLESIAINDQITAINKQILAIRRRQHIINKKTEIIG